MNGRNQPMIHGYAPHTEFFWRTLKGPSALRYITGNTANFKIARFQDRFPEDLTSLSIHSIGE